MTAGRSALSRATVLFVATTVMAFCSAEAIAADTGKAPAKVVQCATCHGENGIGTGPTFPNIAGQKAAYLVKALSDFRAGKRKDEVMSVMAKDLKDDEIAQLADYYEGLGQKR